MKGKSTSQRPPSSSHQVHLSHKQAEAWLYLEDSVTNELLYGGGAGGGKSYLGCLWHIYRRTKFPGSRGLIGRKSLTDLEGSTLVTYFNVAALLGYQIGVDFKYNSIKHIITWSNGSQTILKDLFQYPSDPDFISLGSTEYTDAFIDEANEITEKAFDIINSRIRYKLSDFGLCPKILLTCNPGQGWIKDKYISKDGVPVDLMRFQKVVRALVSDNPNREFADIYSGQLMRMKSDYDRARLLSGDWEAVPESKNPFAHQYDPRFHENKEIHRLETKPIYIAIDFNLNPFAVTFWHHWQDNNGYHFWCFDEAEIQQGSIPAMVDLIRNRYGNYLHSCIITGDAMGNQSNIALKDNASHYLSMQRGLGLSNHQVKVPPNPTHVNSRDDVNKILWLSKQPGARYHFMINPVNCPNLCRDNRMVQCDATGQIIKRNRLDLNQRADYLDTERYFLNLTAKPIILRNRI